MTIIISGDLDDGRAAAAMATSLSQYLMTAALAIIAAEAALVTAFMDKRTRLGPSYILACLGLVAAVLSIMFGGWAITAVYESGLAGNWRAAVHQAGFERQAELLLAELVLFVLSVVVAVARGRRMPS